MSNTDSNHYLVTAATFAQLGGMSMVIINFSGLKSAITKKSGF
jgi:hypothetical protein